MRKCHLQHNINVFANNANFTVKAWFFEDSIINQSIPKPPMPSPAPSGHLTLENFGRIPLYVGSLDGQMPHRQVLQKVSNPPTISDYSHASNGLFKCKYPTKHNRNG